MADQMLYIFGFIASAWGVVSIVGQILDMLKKPNEDQNVRITNLENRIGSIENFIKKDKDSIESLEQSQAVMMRTLLALTRHGIDGNNIDSLRRQEDELVSFLSKSK